MSGVKTNFNIAPYYDDYDKDKNFHRILFRPGFAVQARELTQMQTILQEQVTRFGDNIFKEGSKVFGGDVTLNNQVNSLKLEAAFDNADVAETNFDGKTIEGGTSGAKGLVIKSTPVTVSDQPTLIFSKIGGIDFVDGETITTLEAVPYQANTVSLSGASGVAASQNTASIASISEGCFYISGFFVLVQSQTIALDKYSNRPTKRVGLLATEAIVQTDDDSSILDNAQGTANYAAPGADRFSITLTLAALDIVTQTVGADGTTTTTSSTISEFAGEKFIELTRVELGVKTTETRYPLYAELEKTLARRTFDESGSYTVRPFGIQLKNHITGNNSLISAGLEAGKAYVKGYEYESIATRYVDVEKGRDTANISDYIIAADYGNSLYLNKVQGTFNIGQHELVDLHCCSSADVKAVVSDDNALTKYDQTKMGTARVRSFDWEQADLATSNTTHFHSVYSTRIYDIRLNKTIDGEVSGEGDDLITVGFRAADTSYANSVYKGATLTVNTTLAGTTTSDTVTIAEYIAIGSQHKAICNTALSQKVQSNSTYSISFKFQDLGSIIVKHAAKDQLVAANTTHVVKTTQADIDKLSRFNNDPEGTAYLAGTSKNSLLFQLPFSPLASIPDGITYTYKTFQTVSVPIAGSTTVSTATGSFIGSGSLPASTSKELFSVAVKTIDDVNNPPIDNVTGEELTEGQILEFSAVTGRTATIDSPSQTTLNLNSKNGAYQVEVISTIRTANASPRSKTLTIGNTTNLSTDSDISKGQVHFLLPNKQAGKKDNLMISDVLNLVYVIDSGDSSAPVDSVMLTALRDGTSTTAVDITGNYDLDDGQTDNFYDHASIILKPGSAAPKGQLLVIVDHFSNPALTPPIQDAQAGYFSVASYADVSSNTGYHHTLDGTERLGLNFENIPTFISPTSGEEIRLRDCIDFRPARYSANNDKGSNTTNDFTSNNAAIPASQLGSAGGTPDPEYSLQFNTNYYLGRKDKLVLSKDRVFRVIKGAPSREPITPPDDDDSITLYTLTIPPYTFSTDDIKTKYIDNRRYTMRDIGKLEKRIENLEYYTALSMLEKEAAASSISGGSTKDSLFNPAGDRFKNGILVDGFKGHSVGDVINRDYMCSIDIEKNELRPPFKTDCFRFHLATGSSNNISYHLPGPELVTLPFVTANLVNQPLASSYKAINPYALAQFSGGIKCFPDSDVWYDTTIRPEVLVNLEGVNDNWQFGAINGGHGSQWDDWTKIWTGEQINPEPELSVSSAGATSGGVRKAKLISQGQTRRGITSKNIPDSIKRSIGNKVADISMTFWMRSHLLGSQYTPDDHRIYFVAKGMKPSTNVNIFFDGTNVTANVYPMPFVVLNGVDTALHMIQGETLTEGANVAQVIMPEKTTSGGTATAYIKPIKCHDTNGDDANIDQSFSPGSTTILSSNSGISAVVSNRTVPTKGQASYMSTNLAGDFAGALSLPAMAHKTGERLLRVTDQANNEVASSTMAAECTFHVRGLMDGREATSISVRPSTSRREDVTNENVITSASSRVESSQGWMDPLAQTFIVNKSNYTEGVYVKSVDLFFRQIATANSSTPQLPVTVQIRPLINGLPSCGTILPFAEVSLKPESINAIATIPDASNTSHFTTFEFPAPVYLNGDEYALVLISNSSEYQLWTGIQGLNPLSEDAISPNFRIPKQPNVEKLYLPTNAGNVNISPGEALMFRINRCEFTTINAGNIILMSNTSSESQASSNVFADAYKLNTSIQQFDSSTVTFAYKTSNTAGSYITTDYIGGERDKNVYPTERMMMKANTANSFSTHVTIRSTSKYVAPMIDVSRFNLITTENDVDNAALANSNIYIINAGAGYTSSAVATVSGGGGSGAIISLTVTDGGISDATVTEGGSGYTGRPTIAVTDSGFTGDNYANIVISSELDNSGGPINAKYITRKVNLEDGFEAEDLKVIVNAYKPETATIHAFAKVLSPDDTQSFDDRDYIQLTQETATSVNSLNEDDYKEFIYKSPGDSIDYTDDNGTNYKKFKTFAIKLCLLSTSTLDVPKVKDLRAIALDE